MTRLIAIGFWADFTHSSWPDPKDLVDQNIDAQERQEVADYLDRGIVHEVYRGWSYCRFCDDQNGCANLSDGVYLWPEGLGHYVRAHDLWLPGQFTAHVAVRRADLRAAEIDEEWWTSQFSSENTKTSHH